MGNSVSLAPGNAASTSSGRPLIAREGSISYLIPGAYVAGNPISLAPSNASSTSSGRPLIGREVSISHLIPEAYVTHSTDDAKMIARAANSSRSSVAMPGSTQETSTRALPGRVSKRPRLSMVTEEDVSIRIHGKHVPLDVLDMIMDMLTDAEMHTLSLANKRLHLAVTPTLLKRLGITRGEHLLSVVDLKHFWGLGILCRTLTYTPPSFMLILLPINDAQAESCSLLLLDFFDSPTVRANPIPTVYVTLCGASQPSSWKILLESIVAANVRELQVQQDDKSAHIGSTKLRATQEAFPLSHRHLNAFHAEAPFLFHAEIFPWTRQLVNTSHIKLLTLRCRIDRSPSWSLILPHFDVPSLDSFTVEGRVTITSLAAFLERHPGVKSLKIGAGSCHKVTQFDPARLEPCQRYVLHLRDLEAPVSYLVQLLGSATRSGKASSLNTLTILPDLTATGFPFAACVQHVLHEVADAEDLAWVIIHVPRKVGLCATPWCNLTVPQDCPLPFSAITKLEVRGSGEKKDWVVFSDAFLETVSSMIEMFPSIARLEVSEGRLDATENGTIHREAIIDRFRTVHPKLEQITVRSDEKEINEWVLS